MPHRRTALQRYPVTLSCAVAIVLLHQAVRSYDGEHKGGLGGLHEYGAVSQLVRTSQPELHGPFMLWDGEWWRVLGSGFHHVDWWHVISNAVFLVYLGILLEDRIGNWRMLLFLLAATFLSLLPCFLVGHSVAGLSGGIYAMFGLLFIMRFSDSELQVWLPDFLVLGFFLWLPIGMILAETGVHRVSNLGHASGLVYGIITGLAFYPPTGRARLKPRWFFAGHLLVVPAVVALTHPIWNARYHWRKAVQAEGEERIDRLKIAVQLDPRLGGAWRHLAFEERRRGNLAEAWRARFDGLKANPTDAKIQSFINRAWQRAGPQEEHAALAELRAAFPDAADDWRRNLGLLAKPRLPSYRRYVVWVENLQPPAPDWQPGPDLRWGPVDDELLTTPIYPQTAPAIDPDRPDSALFGTTL